MSLGISAQTLAIASIGARRWLGSRTAKSGYRTCTDATVLVLGAGRREDEENCCLELRMSNRSSWRSRGSHRWSYICRVAVVRITLSVYLKGAEKSTCDS